METQAQRWRVQIETAREMSLTVADWRDLAERFPYRYNWALPFLESAGPADMVAPILGHVLGDPAHP